MNIQGLNSELENALGYSQLLSELMADPATNEWARSLDENIQASFDKTSNGNLDRWLSAFESMPVLESARIGFNLNQVQVLGSISNQLVTALRGALMDLHPWRKGPFELFGLKIDTEWRSDLKWERVAKHVNVNNKDILDVGCGNGYYGWRMLGAGARRVIGLDPMMLYVIQAAAIRRCLGAALPNFVLPGSDALIPKDLLAFDTVFSMGVLYHRNSPIEHLQSLANALKQNGELVLETLVVHGDENHVLVPSGRYAQMRNVWFIPSAMALETWVARCGFKNVRTVDVSPTTINEQRSTEWMHFDSLESFLDPTDHSRTIEGYPAPTRAILIANKK